MNHGVIGADYLSDSDDEVDNEIGDYGNMQWCKTARKGTWYHRGDGFYYHKKYRREGNPVMYLKCIHKACKAGAKCPSNLNGPLIPNLTPHICIRDKKRLPEESFRKDLLVASEVEEPTSLSKQYNNVSKKYHSRITERRPYPKVFKGMQKRKAKKSPLRPANLVQLRDAILASNYIKTYDGPNFIIVGNENNLVLISPKAAELFNQDVIFCCDGTFKCAPRLPRAFQLFVIGGILNKGFIPIAYVLMTKKDKQNYVWVLQQISDLFQNWHPTCFISDYETGSMAAINEVFPDCHQQGCWFHYSQGVEKKARTLGLTQLIRENAQAREIVKRIMVLPLLPDYFIEIGLNMTEVIAEVNFPGNENLKNLLDYTKNYWLQRVGASKISVFGTGHRTNNLQEAFNGNIMLHMGETRTGSHPGIWAFIEAIRVVEHCNAGKYRAAVKNRKITFPQPKKWRLQYQRIEQAQNRLMHENLCVDDFLHLAAHYRNFHVLNPLFPEDLDDPDDPGVPENNDALNNDVEP